MQEVEDYFSQYKQEFPGEDFTIEPSTKYSIEYDSKESSPPITYTSRSFSARKKSREKAIENTMKKVKKYIGKRQGVIYWRRPFTVEKELSFLTRQVVFSAFCRFTFIPELEN